MVKSKTVWKLALAMLACMSVSACKKSGDSALPSVRSGPTLEQREDRLFYEPGASEPFTGTQRGYEKESRSVNHECHYVNGLREGWERRWFKEKPDQMSKQILWVQGERAFFFEYWPNGNLKQLASQRDGSDVGRDSMAHGTYVKWFEDGRVKFRAHYDVDFRWHGKVLDYDDAGELMWDAVFDHGKFVSGHHPPDYQP
jgi:antitoxin component YwqK of YwqJK toxin-antitoxin module